MCRRLMVSVTVLLMALAGVASAVEIRVDFGRGNGVPDWTAWNPGGWGGPASKTIDGVHFTIVGPDDNWRGRVVDGYGDDLTYDCLSFEDDAGGSLTLTITNLPAGSYDLLTYHNSLYDSHTGFSVPVSVNGTQQASGTITLGQDMDNCLKLAVTLGVSGASDVVTIDVGSSTL